MLSLIFWAIYLVVAWWVAYLLYGWYFSWHPEIVTDSWAVAAHIAWIGTLGIIVGEAIKSVVKGSSY